MKTYIAFYSEMKKNINDIGERDKSSKYFLLHFFNFNNIFIHDLVTSK